MDDSNKVKTGTTTLGLVCSDGVVFASDKRATMWHFIADKNIQKVYPITDYIAITTAGSVGDAQALVRYIQSDIKLYETREGRKMTVQGATTLMSNILFGYKMFPFLVQLIIGGVDKEPRLYSLDPGGGVTSEDFISTGSGSPIAYGVLETNYKKDKSIKENLPLAVKAIATAMKRDSATGDGIDLVSIDKSGFKRYTKEEIEKF
ncbi:archaeal proteasome endopeptidase complex subunit beta [Candidatus Micrarchaeota archaeon]|nr:archaeal proteasome endopeptidase complex subunit beta [Candidatus Micrarchaeota archaeon]